MAAGGGGGGELSFRPEIRGMPGLKKNFSSLRASVWSKNKGGGGGRTPRDPISRAATEIINPIKYKKIHNTFFLTCS